VVRGGLGRAPGRSVSTMWYGGFPVADNIAVAPFWSYLPEAQ